MDFETIAYEIENRVAKITLNRPEQLNAYNRKMCSELCSALDVTDSDDQIRAVVITGAGRAFCAGADLSSGAKTFDRRSNGPLGNAAAGPFRDPAGVLTLRLFRSLKPVIAAVNGAAVGVGVTMQLPMDIRIASTEARFGFVFVRRGIVTEGASSWFLPRLVGMSTALEWCYTGRVFGVQEALERGLVRSIHPPDELMPAAMGLALEISDHTAPVAVAMTRQIMWKMNAMEHPMVAHRLESRILQSRGQSKDAAEGIASFLQKRSADYPDRVSTDLPDFFDWSGEPPFE